MYKQNINSWNSKSYKMRIKTFRNTTQLIQGVFTQHRVNTCGLVSLFESRHGQLFINCSQPCQPHKVGYLRASQSLLFKHHTGLFTNSSQSNISLGRTYVYIMHTLTLVWEEQTYNAHANIGLGRTAYNAHANIGLERTDI